MLLCVWQPVLDIKPYLPYCDSVPDSIAPSWVKVIFCSESFWYLMSWVPGLENGFLNFVYKCAGWRRWWYHCNGISRVYRELLTRACKMLGQNGELLVPCSLPSVSRTDIDEMVKVKVLNISLFLVICRVNCHYTQAGWSFRDFWSKFCHVTYVH